MSIIMHSFNNVGIQQLEQDEVIENLLVPKGYVNATEMCKANGKQLKRYNETKSAIAYREAFLKSVDKNDPPPTIEITTGDNSLRGTWMHPKMALDLGRWISADFAVWCDTVLLHVLEGNFQALTTEAAEAQAKLQEQWMILREAGKVTRLKLTDAIKSWYERNPGGTSRPEHAMYAQTTDNIYKALWGKNAKQLEAYLGCDRHEARNTIDSESLAILERAEDRVIEFIDEDNIKPVDAVSAAGIRAKKELPS